MHLVFSFPPVLYNQRVVCVFFLVVFFFFFFSSRQSSLLLSISAISTPLLLSRLFVFFVVIYLN